MAAPSIRIRWPSPEECAPEPRSQTQASRLGEGAARLLQPIGDPLP